ncbi:MAG: class I SAM-dependent methyltransferase [Magnetococcales bacterium]|nr:class I SAM-dependent methyltransferase [Magnetococcales bacterium]
MMERLHGKSIDLARLKSPVLKNLWDPLKEMERLAEHLHVKETAVKQKSCYICNSKESEKRVEIHGVWYATCQNCGHLYTLHRYSEEALRRFYEDNNYYSEITYANKETCYYRREHVALPKVEYVERFTGLASGIWIDVGAGIGDLVSVAQERGWEAIGLELSDSSVNFAKEVFAVDLIRQPLDAYLVENPKMLGCAKVVSIIGVMEHVVNPMELLRQIHAVLAPGGVVVIQVPHANSVSSMVQEVFPQFVFRHMVPFTHIMVFSESSLQCALDQVGFEMEGLWFHGMDMYELMITLAFIDDRIVQSALFRTMMSAMNELQLVMDKRELSDRLICVARKKDKVSSFRKLA